MTITAGSRLGPYQVIAAIGAGGMGEVYKASDTRLNRTVALKVLPAHLSDDPDRRYRFDREAQTIASLNHPHICTLYDIGQEGSTGFLVMEYLEGDTLATRLTRGAIAVDEAMTIAIAVADALEKAHAHGVTHRDLKPGNIMLTPSGAKLLDFGLAKVQERVERPSSSALRAAKSPATTPGMILGTMQYMAPEQLEGAVADARTDIFAFGMVLYEMLTGRRAFEGKSQPHLIAAILSVDPDPPSKLQPAVPPALDFLISRCLAKDPERRLQTATDLLAELQWIVDSGGHAGLFARQTTLTWRTMLVRGGLAAAVLAAAAFIGVAVAPSTPADRHSMRFLVDVRDMPLADALAISPDGKTIAYTAQDGGAPAVFVRPLAADPPKKLPGTEGAGALFWSPDGAFIGFFAGGELKKVDALGAAVQNICETPDLLGGTWNAAGEILFASSKGLQRVAAIGGSPMPVPTAANERRIAPQFLPDGRHYLYLSLPQNEKDAGVRVGSVDTAESTPVLGVRSNAVYVEPGYLLYHRNGTLFAQQFDAAKAALKGDPVRVADRLPYQSTGQGAFAASDTGVLLFRNDPRAADADATTPALTGDEPPLAWIDRSGKFERFAAAGRWIGVDLSPDGRRIAAHRHEAGGGDIWIFERDQETPSRFTFDAAQDNSMPLWSPDGTRIAFSSHRAAKWALYVKAADNTRDAELLSESDMPIAPMSWSPDGTRLLYRTAAARTGGDIWSVPLSGDRQPAPVLATLADERSAQVSPDGKWLAYSSNESGRSEIYIKPFPDGAGRIQVSVNGGVYPRWRRDGREIYFMSLVALGAMQSSQIQVNGAVIQRAVPERLFQTAFISQFHPNGQAHAYAVDADGRRFLIPQVESPNVATGAATGINSAVAAVLPAVMTDRRGGSSTADSHLPLTVVLDWTAALAP